ncbi:hypothetical protein [Granulicoccus sp. GXG6511]|uniref:hypothetical protein n=1 Tax=Granulicoccus sp. GXG6511 TaxID=3381351 RepID=UPI003D7ED781
MRTTLVVDAANVIGSRPDGWWKDRAGAAGRLHAALVAAGAQWDHVILVLEGRARAGVPEGSTGHVTTVHAAASGDDELVAQCQASTEAGDEVTLATADRGLLARVDRLGPGVLGPRTLRDALGH